MTEKEPVICLRCLYVWKSNAAVIRCPQCKSSVCDKVKNVPRVYAGKDLKLLRADFEEYKLKTDEILEYLNKVLKYVMSKDGGNK